MVHSTKFEDAVVFVSLFLLLFLGGLFVCVCICYGSGNGVQVADIYLS